MLVRVDRFAKPMRSTLTSPTGARAAWQQDACPLKYYRAGVSLVVRAGSTRMIPRGHPQPTRGGLKLIGAGGPT